MATPDLFRRNRQLQRFLVIKSPPHNLFAQLPQAVRLNRVLSVRLDRFRVRVRNMTVL